jgi:predicted kinase
MTKLVIFSGPPGVGKSTLSYALAQRTGWALITRDGIDRGLEKAEAFHPRAGYEVIFELSRLNLQNNVSIILDAVFTTKAIRDQIIAIGNESKADVYFVVCTCSDERIWEDRVKKRPEMVAGWTPADWNEVQRVRELYEKWEKPHLVLDSVNSLDENIQKLFRYIGI